MSASQDSAGNIPMAAMSAEQQKEALTAICQQLFDDARQGRLKELEEWMASNKLPVDLTNHQGNTLLMLAAYHGHADVVRMLLRYEADPNRLNDRGQSPMAGAIFKNENEVVEALLEGGADPEWGGPSAWDTMKMFRKEQQWEDKFKNAKGRSKERERQRAAGRARAEAEVKGSA